MYQLVEALLQTGLALWDLFTALLGVLVPWTPLAAWIAFWLLAVNWVKLRETLAKGGWVAIVLAGFLAILVWGNVSPPGAPADFFGLKISHFVEKTVYVSGLICLMFLAGALQLSGACGGLCQFEQPILIADGHDHDRGRGDQGHGHH